MSAIDSLLAESRLVVCVGPGGVGKTTVAAALGLRASALGRRAAVITIDPARRLADALGLGGLSDELSEVSAGEHATGTLSAAMLDTKSSYDALMRRLTSPRELEAIESNRVYQAFSRSLARSHAYIAAERLYEIASNQQHDVIVLDTPPTRSALDILDAPTRLSQFLDDRVLRFFLAEPEERSSLSAYLAAGSRGALRVLGAIASETVASELLGFFRVLAHLGEGFATRARATSQLLRSATTSYVLVAAPTPTSLADASHLALELAAREAHPNMLILNRAYIPELFEPRSAAKVPSELVPLALRLSSLVDQLAAEQAHGIERGRALRDQLRREAPLVGLADRAEDVRDLAGLAELIRSERAL